MKEADVGEVSMAREYIATDETAANGHAPAAPRRMPVATRRVELDGKYRGWWFDLNTDAPFGLFLRVMDLQGAAGADEATARRAFAELVQLLPELVLDWNFVDRQGAPIPCDGAGLLRLPLPLIQAIFANIGPEPAPAPKGLPAASAPTLTTAASRP